MQKLNANKRGGRSWCGIFFCSSETKLIVVMGGHSPNLDEMLLHFMLLLSAILAMASFYFTSSYSTTLWIYFVGVVGGLLIAVPDWAFFNRSPRSWMEPLGNEAAVHLGTQAMSRMKRLQRSAAPGSSGVQDQEVPFRLSSFPCFPTSAIYTTPSGGSR